MTKIVNSWNEWDPLKRVIVGRPEGTQIHAPEPGWEHHYPDFGFPVGTYGPMPQEMVDKANEQMDAFCKMMDRRPGRCSSRPGGCAGLQHSRLDAAQLARDQ